MIRVGNSFLQKNVCLGSTIDFLLDDATDVINRINKARKSIGALKCVWDAKEVTLMTKTKLHEAIPMNIVSCGSENWSGNEADLNKLERFHHGAIRRILGIRMDEVKDEKITNGEVRRIFGNIKKILKHEERDNFCSLEESSV